MSNQLVNWLQIHIKETLDWIANEDSITVWRQGWYSTEQLDIYLEGILFQGPIFDHNHSWDYLDGTCQNHICGLGFIMYENDFSYFSFKANVGEGTNNLVKLLSLLVLLKFAYN